MISCASVKMVSRANTYLKYSYKPEIFFSNKTKNSLFNDEKISKIASDLTSGKNNEIITIFDVPNSYSLILFEDFVLLPRTEY